MSSSVPGYFGRYLRVDLTNRTARDVELPPDVLRRFIGGAGLGTWLLLNETPGEIDALSPESPVCFVFSPLVGSPITTSAKFSVVSKSPLTNRINDSLSSSHFAISGKKTGYDALVIVGESDGPTMLVIDNGDLRFVDATSLWGQAIPATEQSLREQLGGRFRSAVIGPAGENGVRFATVSHDGRHAGRGGTGAVMGAKNLKAVCVSGDREVEFTHPEELVVYSRRLSKLSLGEATAKYRELGTVANLAAFNRMGALPTRNFQSGTFDAADMIAPETFAKTHRRTRESCAACTIGCEHVFDLTSLKREREDEQQVRMEYENLFALGPLCGISDADAVLHASKYCDDVGMDTISAGATIAFAMECAERGLINQPDLRFGNPAALHRSLEEMSGRQGLGELLSLGTRAASEQIGRGSEDFAPHVKGLEIPGYEPRALQTMALGFAVGTRGADHNRSGAYQVDFSEDHNRFAPTDDAVTAAIATEDEAAILDSLILCKFLRGVFDDRMAAMAEMLSLTTGWDVDADELEETARRIVTAKKWYNIQQGWTPDEDRLPSRFFESELPTGASRGAVLSRDRLSTMIEQYNRNRGWTNDGWVPEELALELGILESELIASP